MKEAEDTVNALAICLGVIGGVFLLLLTFYLVRKYFFDPTSYRREFGSPSSTNKEGDMGVREYEAHGNGGNGYDRQVAQRVDQCYNNVIERVESVEAEGINPVTGKPRKFYAEFKVTGAKKHVDDIMNKVAYA